MDEREMTTQENAEERTGGTAPDAGEQEKDAEEGFEALIRGKYKEEFDARVRRILDGRLRGLRQENERLRQRLLLSAAVAVRVGRRMKVELLRCAMEFAVRRARQQLVQSIASGGSRVAENAGRRRSVSRWDPRGLSGEELAAIRKRVQSGEKIRF